MTENVTKKTFESSILWRIPIYIMRFWLAFASIIIVLAITAAVVLRYVFHTDLYGLEEIEMLLAMWIYFIGCIHGSYQRNHISADIMMVILKSDKAKKTVRLIISIVSFAVSVFFAKWAIDYWNVTFEIGGQTTGLKMPLALQRIPISVGFVCMVVYNLYHMLCDITGHEPVIICDPRKEEEEFMAELEAKAMAEAQAEHESELTAAKETGEEAAE